MENIKFLGTRFKHNGQYSLTSYYNLLYDTFRSMGYIVHEYRYRNVLGPDGKTGELELFWNCSKNMDNYCSINIHAKTLIVGMGKKQTQIDGKAVERDTATVELEMKSHITIDRMNAWDASPIFRNFKSFYDTFYYKKSFGNAKRVLMDDHYKVDNEMKAFFNMQGFV